jgi:Zn-dependent protease with chaperone function
VVAAALALSTARALRRRARLSGDAARELLRDARRTVLSGYDVWLVESARPAAMSFPARHGGIVITTGAVEALDPAELVAVLAHEDAHVRQRHHLVSALLAGLADSVRWVPLAVAAHDALPHYLEIAADGQARRRAGTSALVGALLTLGERAQPVSARSGVLHAAGPERIRQLVHPARGSAGAVPTLVFLCYLIVLVSTTVAVQLPYVTAALHGC